jgi:hypothetical protein
MMMNRREKIIFHYFMRYRYIQNTVTNYNYNVILIIIELNVWIKVVGNNLLYTNIHALSGIRTHGLSVQAIKAYASDRASPYRGFIFTPVPKHYVTYQGNGGTLHTFLTSVLYVYEWSALCWRNKSPLTGHKSAYLAFQTHCIAFSTIINNGRAY